MTAPQILDCTDAEYLADPCPVPSLSSSIAKVLVDRSPAHAWSAHPRLGGRPRPPTKEMDIGSVTHALILGAGKSIAVVEADDWRTKEARAARDRLRAEGKVAVLKKDFDKVSTAVESVRKQCAALGFKFTGASEIPIMWEEESTLGPVLCRAMIDHFENVRIIDLKTTVLAKPDACARSVVDYGYAIQQAAYQSAMGKLYPELAGRLDFLFLFAELDPPYCVTPARLDGRFREIGRMQWERAIETWARCRHTGEWPSYTSEIVMLEPPAYFVARELGDVA